MLGDLFTMLAGGTYVAKKCFDEINENGKCIDAKLAMDKFIKEHTDFELEKKLKQDIENPNKFNEIYERLEEYKNNNGRYYLGFQYIWDFRLSNNTRLRLTDRDGGLYGRTKKEADELYENRWVVLEMLMHTYEKMTYNQASWIASGVYGNGHNNPDSVKKYIL